VHRFYIEQKLQIDEEIKLPEDVAHQLAQVLRMKVGEKVTLFNGDGFEYLSEIMEGDKKRVAVKIKSRMENTREPKVSVTLFQAVIKKDKMEWVAEKATEVGATKIVPVLAERSVKNGVNEGRMRKIIKEAAEQSGRAIVPEFGKITSFEKSLKIALEECDIVYVAHLPATRLQDERGQAMNTAQAGEGVDQSQAPTSIQSHKTALFIGPEGGFSDAEIQTATALGVKIISLGSTILRAETAAVTGVYRLVNNF
jgi:16S rRNA (uracil1498-N3)-methyltransferase